jgi:tetratricopeptide (TPR) repeat protein
MNRKMTIIVMSSALFLSASTGMLFARGFGGGFRGGFGGFRGGGFGGFRGGYGGFRGGYGGFGGGYGGFRAGYGGYHAGYGGYHAGYGSAMGYGSRGVGEGMYGGRIEYGSRAASYATAGGRTFTDVGRAGVARGPYGGAVAGRSNLAVASGPRGTTVAERSYGAIGYRPHGFNTYGAYHSGWVHGYWNGHDAAAWGWRGPYWGAWGMGLGMGLGWGLAAWGFGSSLYSMGYMPYANPYYDAATAVAAPYDYGQPIDTTAAPAEAAVTDPALALFDAGRASFRQGNYADALKKTDEALAKLPNDIILHEFRALCLFAQARYDEAAAILYAVLSDGPGWDWTTLISLYPDVGVYTAQLRSLEAYCRIHSDAAAARFVLVYHYLTQGFNDAAVRILKQVLALKPADSLSAKLLRQLDAPRETTDATAAPAPSLSDTTPPEGASIAGTWSAAPNADTSISLSIRPEGEFTWKVMQKGRKQQFTGSSTFGNGLLTLAQEKGPALAGRVSWKDANHMTFRIVGDGPDDPGLSFSK